MAIILYLIVAFILSLFIGQAGEKREIGYYPAFFVSLIFSPLIGILIVLASDKRKQSTKDSYAEKILNTIEKAKKEEFKNNKKEAVSLYLDAIYYAKEALFKHNLKISDSTANEIKSVMGRLEDLNSQAPQLTDNEKEKFKQLKII